MQIIHEKTNILTFLLIDNLDIISVAKITVFNLHDIQKPLFLSGIRGNLLRNLVVSKF